ncbi:MAG: hypothetical protein RIC35_08050 [Marinoscillum sp.]
MDSAIGKLVSEINKDNEKEGVFQVKDVKNVTIIREWKIISQETQ